MKFTPRLFFFCTVFAGFLVSSHLHAAEIPEEILKISYDECIKEAQTNKYLTKDTIAAYCECSKEEIREKMTLAEMMEMSMGVIAKQPLDPKHKEVLKEIAIHCISKTF